MYDNIFTVAERKAVIADSLKYLRKIKRMTQKEVAQKIGVNTEAYATYERGRNEPPAEILVRLSFLYNVPIDIIVQKENFVKDRKDIKKQLENFEMVAEEFSTKIISGDPETRELLGEISDGLKNMFDSLTKITDQINK